MEWIDSKEIINSITKSLPFQRIVSYLLKKALTSGTFWLKKNNGEVLKKLL